MAQDHSKIPYNPCSIYLGGTLYRRLFSRPDAVDGRSNSKNLAAGNLLVIMWEWGKNTRGLGCRVYTVIV